MSEPFLKIYNDSEELMRQYWALMWVYGIPRKGVARGIGSATIPKSVSYNGPPRGWVREKAGIWDGPGDPAPDNEGLVVTNDILAVDGQTRTIPTIGPVTLNLSGGVELPEDWTKRNPTKPPWI